MSNNVLTLKEYIEEKILLLRDFGITLNKKQMKHIQSLKNEIQVDNFAHDLLRNSFYLDEKRREGPKKHGRMLRRTCRKI